MGLYLHIYCLYYFYYGIRKRPLSNTEAVLLCRLFPSLELLYLLSMFLNIVGSDFSLKTCLDSDIADFWLWLFVSLVEFLFFLWFRLLILSEFSYSFSYSIWWNYFSKPLKILSLGVRACGGSFRGTAFNFLRLLIDFD